MSIFSAQKTFFNLFVLIQGLLFCSASSLAQPVADFSATPVSGCSPLLVQFKDSSSGNPTNWKWDLGNGTTSVKQNPSTTYFQPGKYKITLIAGSPAGEDTIVKDQFITIHFAPTIDFIGDPVTGCYPLSVQFFDQSIAGSGTLNEWEWDFGDGVIGSGQNPQHIYTAAGTYGVTLTATNNFGCSKSLFKTQYINIVEGVTADFINNVQNTCKAPVNMNFLNYSTGSALTYQWDFGDGSGSILTNPAHVYSTAGTFIVRLTATNPTGCSDIMEKQIVIGSVNADFSSPASVCPGETFSVVNTSVPIPGSVFWDFGDGTTSNKIDPTKIYTLAGNYSITMIANFGACLDTLTKPITVLAKQNFSFTVDDSLACQAPHIANFSSNAPGASAYNWDFGDGSTSQEANPSHTYASSGSFNVTLEVLNASGCMDTLKMPKFIRIQGAVISLPGLPLKDCVPFTPTFSANINSVDSIVSYNWDFGDSTTSGLANPTHTFTVPGSYTISLSVTSSGGCVRTVTVPNGVIVGNKPTANFSATPRDLCAKTDVNFTDLSTGNADAWVWKFGDGTTSIDQNPTHTYKDTGFFTVTLIAISSGCPDSISFSKYIHIKPAVANFSVLNVCSSPLQKIFTDSSKEADTWQWDFGDGGTSTSPSPIYTYTDTGSYTVTLKVTNLSTGCDHTTTKIVRVINPIADFVTIDTAICRGTSITFNTLNINPSDISTYFWNFGDGVFRSVPTPGTVTHKYNKSGTFDVKLRITDVFGCKDSLIIPKYIKVGGPSSYFRSTVNGTCVNNPVLFIDSSQSDGTTPITQWIWNYGDNTIDTLSAPPYQHSYSRPGIYTVLLTTVDKNGCVDSLVRPFYIVISQPVADFSTKDTSSCPSSLVRFTNLSNGSNSNLIYSWDFGDGAISAAPNPVHSYSAIGNYTITLKITDQFGCSDSIIKQNYINITLPVSNFSLSDSIGDCPPFLVTFSNSSLNYTSLFWDFGDGNTSSESDPRHTYFLPGVYTIRLRATGPGGCFDEKLATIILNGPTGVLDYTNIAGCNTLQTNFKAGAKKDIIFTWDFNDGVTVTTSDSVISHTYTTPGFYLPKVILEDDKGCKVPIIGVDTIKVYEVQANFTASTTTICDAGFINFIGSSTSNDIISGYFWNFGDGTTSIQQSPSHGYTSPGLYNVRLIVTTQSGCKDTTEYNAYIKVVEAPEINILANTAACELEDVIFSGNFLQPDTSVVSWEWNFGNGQTSSQQNPEPQQYSITGTYTVIAIATNSSGCKDTATHTIFINPLPQTNAGDDAFLCLGTPLQLQASGANTFQWLTPTNNLSCTSCAAPVTTTPDNITYVVRGISSFGCEKTDSINIRVKRPFTVTVTPDTDSICIGQQIQLNAFGAENYLWTSAATLSSSTIQNPFASPDTNTTYKVVGLDSANCFKDSAFVSISVFPFPLVELGADETIKVGASIALTSDFSDDVIKLLWTPAAGLSCTTCPAPVSMPNATTTYTLQVENNGGCSATDNVTVIVTCNNENIFIPNTFSPNGDGANDIFYVRGSGLFAIKNLRIINRWGEVVFEKSNVNPNDISQGWDGTYKEEMLLPDVFVYMANVVCNNNEILTYSGNITLIR